jgi:hypothetical protein
VLALVDFVTELTLTPESPEYVVDILWNDVTELHDWSAMTSLLENEDLTQLQQRMCVRVLNATAKKAAGEWIVPKPKKEIEKDKKV